MNFLALVPVLAGSLSTPMAVPDPTGSRFFCGAQRPTEICLSVLRPTCRLAFVSGLSIPPEAEDHVLLQSGTESRTVNGPDQLAGCVSIQSEQAAVEYLRFFSSRVTVHMFEVQELEVFTKQAVVKAVGVCISKNLWKKLGLSEPAIVRNGEAFRITRVVIKPFPKPWKVSLYRVVDQVDRDGHVNRLSEQQIKALEDDLAELSFPMYL